MHVKCDTDCTKVKDGGLRGHLDESKFGQLERFCRHQSTSAFEVYLVPPVKGDIDVQHAGKRRPWFLQYGFALRFRGHTVQFMSVLRTEYSSFLADQRKASMLDTCGYTISLRKQCLAGLGPRIHHGA